MAVEQFELTFEEVVAAICQYPKMYLMDGTFAEAFAFLNGYADGRQLGLPGRSSSVFNPFRDWLCSRHGWKDTEDFWRSFRDTYGEDQVALNEFARLWSEYTIEDIPKEKPH